MLSHPCLVNSHARGHVPPLHHSSVNLPEHVYHEAFISFSVCQKLKLELTSKWARALAACCGVRGGLRTLGSGFPVIFLSSSWRCGQLPWEYQPGLSSDGRPSLSSTSFTAQAKTGNTTQSQEFDQQVSCCRSRHTSKASSNPGQNHTTQWQRYRVIYAGNQRVSVCEKTEQGSKNSILTSALICTLNYYMILYQVFKLIQPFNPLRWS